MNRLTRFAALTVAIGAAALEPARAEHGTDAVHADARRVIEFWQDAGPSLWFAKSDVFDRRFRDGFLELHEQAARGELDGWTYTADGALALVILLDQFPRNSFRDTPRMYGTDAKARTIAAAAIAAGLDRELPDLLAMFMYLPFGHSESIADQNRSVDLATRLGGKNLSMAEHHRDIVRRFGRFPHRNPILGREMRPEEQAYLDQGGYTGAQRTNRDVEKSCGAGTCSA